MNNTANLLRNDIKKLGFNNRKISVREEQGGTSWSFNITIKDLTIDIKPIKKIAENYCKVDRCEASGEILSGGNTYVSVNYDWKLREESKFQLDVII